MPALTRIVYVTSSAFKAEENKVLLERVRLRDGTPVRDLFTFEIRQVPILETLEVDLRVMVQAEVTNAYSQLKVPCIVEHAGLVFMDYLSHSYPGGLTKPMWNALGDRFVSETGSAGRRAIARAVVAYCDGMNVHTFVGEREGTIANEVRGSRHFYWDTVFIPDDPTGASGGRTYAEIVDDPALGLPYKIEALSQSTAAMLKFLEYLRACPPNEFWPNAE
jgi:inosine/xanthosine triphosphate pyrophosphatase family protein